MRPKNLKSRIFLDSGDPEETKKILNLLGFLDGQTTNPSLIVKNPRTKIRIESKEKFTETEISEHYRNIVTEISSLIPNGSVSIEVYADKTTKADDIFNQGKEMFHWIHNAHIKYPISRAGLEAAERSVHASMRMNMTLCFNQEQAAAVYAATRGAKKGTVFVSPFVGRLDDRGENGMDIIKNILTMYKNGDNHVEVLAASVRNIEHLLYALYLKSDIITAPYAVLKEWGEKECIMPEENFNYNTGQKRTIAYERISLHKNWQDYNIQHQLTDIGLKKFSDDWNTILQN